MTWLYKLSHVFHCEEPVLILWYYKKSRWKLHLLKVSPLWKLHKSCIFLTVSPLWKHLEMNGWTWLKPRGDEDVLIQKCNSTRVECFVTESSAGAYRPGMGKSTWQETEAGVKQTRLQQMAGDWWHLNTQGFKVGCLYGLSSPPGREVPRGQGFKFCSHWRIPSF